MKPLSIIIVGILIFTSAQSAPSQGKALKLSYDDLTRIVDGSVCKDKKSWGGICEPETLKIQDALSGQELVTKCPGCLRSLKIRGRRVSGRLKVVNAGVERELDFIADAPPTADLDGNITKRLDDYYSFHFFTRAARPRGLATDGKGNLLVTDFGTGKNDSKVWQIPLKEFNKQDRLFMPADGRELVGGLPSAKVDTTFQGRPIKSIVGLTSVSVEGSVLLGLVNRIIAKEGADPLAGLHGMPIASLLRVNLGANDTGQSPSIALKSSLQPDTAAPFSVLASLWDFEQTNNPDSRDKECDPFGLVVRNGYAYATDSGGNDLLRLNTATNQMNLYAVFEELPNASFDPRQPESFSNRSQRDPVPTGITFGPDGAIYVAFIGGYPFPRGGSGIYRLEDKNGDGDALDTDEKRLAVEGLTCAIGVAFDAKGNMYTSQYSLDFLKNAPGRICQIRDGKCAVTLADKVFSPTSIIVIGNYIYFSQEFLGLVGRLPLPAATR